MNDLSRVEQLLRNVLGEDIYEVTPQSRIEALLVELNELIEGMGGSVSPEDIATAVAAYLDEHLTNPTSPPIDTSLTIVGAAADSKKVGDELSTVKEDLDAISTATTEDVGKALKVKTVTEGKVTEWEFGEAGGDSSGDEFTQWRGKTWYAYGTSITNIASEGRYATYLAQMSGMTLVNKGISGGGIGDFGSYSTGQVYDAICNVTDGKLNADLITLETGANDVDAGVNVPLGTVYDTGQSTLAGCLNDCLRYLQDHTSAQIVVIPSPASALEDPHSANVQKYYEWAKMVEEICFINRVSFINSNNNMGFAKLASSYGSRYTPDGVHHTDLGGLIFARHIWYQLRNIPVFDTFEPSPTDWETMFSGSVTMEEISDEWSTYKGAYITNYPEQLVEGDSYRVTYNGTQYLCTVVEDPNVYVDYLGNAQWSGGSTSPNQEPFAIINEGNDTVSVYTDESVGTTITLKIEKHT